MEMTPVKSSQIKAVGYDPETRKLRVQFIKGSKQSVEPLWEYSPITQEAYNEFIAAESLGSHFYKHIKTNDRVTSQRIE